ncbi:MAG TPA: iron ABC transporter permease [Gemmatimonadaceae bacterium]|jgi:iron complex transport system permease protein
MARRAEHRRRVALVLAALGVALLALVVVSLCLGRYPVALHTVASILGAALRGAAASSSAWTDTEWIVVTTVRLPRVIVAAIAGAGLGLSGAAVQGLFRNPLAGPQVLGISNGAAWGGVVAILLGGSAFATVGLAFAFAFLALIAVFALDRFSGTRTVLSIVLAGVIVSAFFSALVGLAQYFANPERQLPGIVYWLLGSFAATTSRSAWIISVPSIAAGVILLAIRWRLNLLSLGDADAKALGVRVDALRWSVLTLVTLLVAAQVAVSGTIGWVGLVVPHLARRLVGPSHEDLLPASALLGAIYLLAVDDVARTIAVQEIPIGVLTALIGTPVFALVFWKAQSRGWARG